MAWFTGNPPIRSRRIRLKLHSLAGVGAGANGCTGMQVQSHPHHYIQYTDDSYTDYTRDMAKTARTAPRWSSYGWDDSLPFQLRRASQAWTTLWLHRVPDLTNPQFAVLLLLGQHGALDQSELGALASVDRSTLSVLVDRLEARGLVTKTMDPANRRRRIIELTDAGYRRLDDAAEVAEVVIGQVRERFDAEGFEQLVRLLRNLGDMSPTPVPS
jgi:DNA-binding MarR family transcriptional regulator